MLTIKNPVLTELTLLFHGRPFHQNSQRINLEAEAGLITGLRGQNGGTSEGECHGIAPRRSKGPQTNEC